ncbi:MAG: glutamate--tRNA ligase [Cyanobacteria bacterium]|nr:glutamate--tRNA ligase [Cyanobacteriota bacterium]
MSDVRVRIAPSPTGFLHVGTARTALFNFLFAKKHQGKFILRIEDTDLVRSKKEYCDNIYESLLALGLQWDEGPDVGGPYGPYQQSERLDIYQEWAEKLLASGQAYWCYLSEAEIEAEKQKAALENRPYVYQRPHYDAETLEKLKNDPERKPSLRLDIPRNNEPIVFQDLIRGEITFDRNLLDNFVLIKSNGTPSYNFAVVVDDLLMKITHVIRGEDHISNTPKQILIFRAFGIEPPAFAHVSMILSPDRSKLSKRHGATAVSDFIKQGYLPEAFCNFLALLGWSPPEGMEIGTLDAFASFFSLEKISHSAAIFDQDKLKWLNGCYIRQLPLDDLLERARPFLNDFNLDEYTDTQLQFMLEAVREPITLLSDLPHSVSYFFGEGLTLDASILEEVLRQDDSIQVLNAFANTFLLTQDFTHLEGLSLGLKEFTQQMKPLKAKTVMWAIRAALTGRTHGADLGKTLFLLGASKVKHRLDNALVLATKSVI